ncbi:hypothetical protein [Bacillus weihaiensis]|uniref:Transposase n=1 Tax=Bacillus weihaiensis TaxID=1547283 RepID=A0A1L3MS42_9BACI|nr:hypothetical protein [Bacillus weihaiensis]APH05140.1 hypothetical protein A9C19_10470 [Bacillus weihaiensis]
MVKLEHYFVDGTKIEANANQYTFVWRKTTEKYEKSLDDQYRQLALQIEQILEEEENGIQYGEGIPLFSLKKPNYLFLHER